MKKNMTICKLCRKNPAIENSHIIPEFMYKPIYDEDHRYMPFSKDYTEIHKIEQKGYREPLLCLQCEGKISVIENRASKFLDRLHSLKPEAIEGNLCVFKIDGIDDFKRCSLINLWRMGESTHPNFINYSLGPYNEILRKRLDDDTPFAREEFPIILTQLYRGTEVCVDLIVTYKTTGRLKDLTVQTYIANGLIIDTIMTLDRFPEDWMPLINLGAGLLVVKKEDLSELQRKEKLIDFSARHNETPRKFYDI